MLGSMRRSVIYTEPKTAFAGETKTWKFIYVSANNLSKGACFRFDVESEGRDFDWEIPQSNLKRKKNLIWMEIPKRKLIGASEVLGTDGPFPQFEFTLPAEVKAGDPIIICLGTPDATTTQDRGNRAQFHTCRRRPFNLYIDPKGKGEFKEVQTFHLDVKGNALHSIRVIAPSIVNKNQRFDVVIRFEDRYGNLTKNAPEGTLIEFSYERLRENINWKLFVPETGFTTLPNLYFNEVGVYKIQLTNLSTSEVFSSFPIKCFADIDRQAYWGTFHNEFARYDATENIESCLRHARDEKSYQFFSSSSFENEEETSSNHWRGIGSYIAEFNEDNRFITFLGMQWLGTPGEEGLREFIYLKDNRALLRRKESKSNNLQKIYKSHTPKEFFSIPSFTMGSKTLYNFEKFTPEYERVVEIYNVWGCSECTKAEGNLRPIIPKSKKGIKEKADGSIRKALNSNHRFGFVSGGYDNRSIFNELLDGSQTQYTPGLTAILSASHTREGILHAIFKRSCYATTGPRIIVGFQVAGSPIGSELTTKTKLGLIYNRHISGYVVGTAPIEEVLIIRNGKPFHAFHPKGDTFEFTFDDDELLKKIILKTKKDRPPFIYYYMRVLQDDGHIAWASPIWIDHEVAHSAEKKKG